MDIEQSYPW